MNPPCPLRRTCEYCLTSYGRKYRKPTRPGAKPCLESVVTFKTSRFCCKDHKDKQRAIDMAAENRRKAEEKQRLAVSLKAAENTFIYGVRP